jgi:hypothetical protein
MAAKNKEQVFVICDVCQKEIEQEHASQLRCVSGVEGELSPCQVIAKNRIARKHHEDNKGKLEERKKVCLKCGEKFKSKGDYNRICDPCSAVNGRVTRTMHKTGLTPSGERVISYA